MPKEMDFKTRFRFLYSDLKIFETTSVPEKLKDLHLLVFRAHLKSLEAEEAIKRLEAHVPSEAEELKAHQETLKAAREALVKFKAEIQTNQPLALAEAARVDAARKNAFQFADKRLVTLDGSDKDAVSPIKFGFVKGAVCDVVHLYFTLKAAENSGTDKNLVVDDAAVIKLFVSENNDLYEAHHALALPPTQLQHYVSRGPSHNFPVLMHLYFDVREAPNALVLDEEAFYSYSELHQYILFLAQKRGFKTVSYREAKLNSAMAYEPHVVYFNNRISLGNSNPQPVVLPNTGVTAAPAAVKGGAPPSDATPDTSPNPPAGPPANPDPPTPADTGPPTPLPEPGPPEGPTGNTPAPPEPGTPTNTPTTPGTPTGPLAAARSGIQYFAVRSSSPVNVPLNSTSVFLHYCEKKAHDFCKLYIEKQTDLTGITYPDYDLTTFLANNTNRWELPSDAFYFSYGVNGFSRV